MVNTPNSNAEETIFSMALRCAPTERLAYLDQACAGDSALRQRLEEMLQAQAQLGEFMESPPGSAAPGARETLPLALPPDETLGSRIGRYKLLQKLGEGGCGVVYMAEQEEPVLARPPSKLYEFQKSVRRHKAGFAATAAIIAALAAGVGVSSWQAQRASQAQHRAALT